jgi:autophagy-related protein 13
VPRISFEFIYLFYLFVVNQFNLETPDSELLTKEMREKYKTVSTSPHGPPALEVQVLLSVPELANNQVLVYTPDTKPTSRIRHEPARSHILLESWSLQLTPQDHSPAASTATTPLPSTSTATTPSAGYNPGSASTSSLISDVAPPVIYKHGIVLFRSVYALLRILPAWRLHKKLKRRIGGLGMCVRVRGFYPQETSMLAFSAFFNG